MYTLVVQFALQEGVSPEQFLEWSQKYDVPQCLSYPECKSFSVYTTEEADESEAIRIVEIIEVTSPEAWNNRTASDEHSGVMKQWNQLAREETVDVFVLRNAFKG